MYESIDLLPELLEAADKFVIENDRALYLPYFKAIETYCNLNAVLIGGKIGVDLLAGTPPGRDSWVWELYADYAFEKAKALCDAVVRVDNPHISPNYAVMNTRIRNREFTLDVNGRRLAVIYNIERARGFPLSRLLSPPVRKGPTLGLDVKCVSPEMQLIGIYRKLYSPLFAGQWASLREIESVLYALAIDGLVQKTGMIKRGGARGDAGGDILDVVGKNAIILNAPERRASIITDENPEEILKRVSKQIPGCRIIKFDLNILDDFQLTKHVIQGPAGPVLNIYDETSYELVPFEDDETPHATAHATAHAWVQLRHQFIDLWSLKIIINTIPNARRAAEEAVRAIVDTIKYIKSKPIPSPDPKKYRGVYITENVAKKKLVSEKGERFKPYYGA